MSTVDSVLKQTSGDVAREAEVSLVSTWHDKLLTAQVERIIRAFKLK